MTAVKLDGQALRYADVSLQKDPDILSVKSKE